MADEIASVRTGTSEAFGVNVFAPGAPAPDREALTRYVDSLSSDAAAVGATLGEPTWDDDQFHDKIAALLTNPPPIVSFTFGCPSTEVIAALRDVGTVVALTVTRPEEATIAAAAGADVLCVQGDEAGRAAAPSRTPAKPQRAISISSHWSRRSPRSRTSRSSRPGAS